VPPRSLPRFELKACRVVRSMMQRSATRPAPE
jgi:hypothetical protein